MVQAGLEPVFPPTSASVLLDVSLHFFLGLIIPFFLLPGSHKVLSLWLGWVVAWWWSMCSANTNLRHLLGCLRTLPHTHPLAYQASYWCTGDIMYVM